MREIPSQLNEVTGSGSVGYAITVEPFDNEFPRLFWSTKELTLTMSEGNASFGSQSSWLTGSAPFTGSNNRVFRGDEIEIGGQTYYIERVDAEFLRLDNSFPGSASISYRIIRSADTSKLIKDGLGSINHSIDLSEGGGYAQLSNFDFEIINHGYSKNLPDILQNRIVDVRMIGSGSDFDWETETLPYYKFAVNDISWNHNVISFDCYSSDLLKHKQIPLKTINAEDYGSASKGNLGKPIPFIYGDWRLLDRKYQSGSMFYKALLIDDTNERRYISADHDIVTAGVNGQIIQSYYYESSLKQFCRHNDFEITVQNDTGSVHELDPRFNVVAPPFGNDSGLDSGVTDGEWVQLADRNDSTPSEIDGDTTKIFSYDVQIPSYDDNTLVYLVTRFLATDMETGGDDNLRLRIYDAEETPNLLITRNYTSSNGTAFTYDGGEDGANGIVYETTEENNRAEISTAWHAETNIGQYVTLTADYTSVSAPDAAHFFIYELYLRFDKCRITSRGTKENLPDEIYASSVRGRPYGDWISGRDPGFGTNDSINNSVYIVESILRDILDYDHPEIHTSSFDDLGTGDRQHYSCSFQQLKQIDSKRLIDELATENSFIVSVDHRDRVKVISTETSSVSTRTQFTRDDYVDETFFIEKTHIDELVTDFELQYNLNYATNGYEKREYANSASLSSTVSSSVQTICSASSAAYRVDNKKIYKSRFLRAPSSIELGAPIRILSDKVENEGQRKSIINFKTGLQAIDVELGDIIVATHPDWKNDTAASQIVEYSHDLATDEITIAAKNLLVDDQITLGTGIFGQAQ